MSEYLEWRDDSGRGPVVRVHRRVIAGLEREDAPEFRGILLGSHSPGEEVAVEDYAPLPPGTEFDPRTGAIAGQRRHSLTPLGYFRMRRGQGLLLDENDRAVFDRWFPSPEAILLLFERQDGRVDWADVRLQHGVAAPPEAVATEAAAEEAQPEAPVRAARPRYLWPAVAGGAVLLIVGAAYLAADHDARRHDGAVATASKPHPPLPEWRPVPAPVQPTPTPGPPVAAPPGNAEADRTVDGGHGVTPESKERARKEIRAVLERWRQSLLANDVNSYVSLYAPSVGPYFRENRVDRAQIAGEVQRMLNRYGAVTSYKISAVTIAPVDENHAIANFRKEWRTERNAFSGAEKAQLRFVRENGQWLIASEQELRVYWARKR
jgi:hypothetical protein